VDRDQAAIVFELLRGMALEDPKLAQKVKAFRRSMVREDTGASSKVLSADVGTKHGLNAHGVVVDELHAHPNRELLDLWTPPTVGSSFGLAAPITSKVLLRHRIRSDAFTSARPSRTARQLELMVSLSLWISMLGPCATRPL
jgi:hypothetical protein